MNDCTVSRFNLPLLPERATLLAKPFVPPQQFTFCRRIAMICASVYLLVFIRIHLVHVAEKILLLQPLKFGGDYHLMNDSI